MWLLSIAWGEIGWQLPQATTLDELRQALEPLRGLPNDQHVSVFLRRSFVVSTAEDVRAARKKLGKAIEDCRLARERHDRYLDAVRTAELAMNEAKSEQQEVFLGELLKGWRERAEALKEWEAAQHAETDLDRDVRAKETGFALSELLDFIKQKKYARNPLRLANAMAGLPDMGWEQSYARCSAMKCSSWPQFQFRLFRTIKAIWNRRNSYPELTLTQLFRQEIKKLHRTVMISVPQPPPNPPRKGKMDNPIRSYLAENWRSLRLGIEEITESETQPDRMPFLILVRFMQNLARPRTPQDLVLIAKEKIT